MTKNEILSELSSLGNEKRKQMYIKNGAGENTYGVLLGELRKMAKKLGPDHELAKELWASENMEARWIACMLLDPKKLSLEEVRQMVSELTYPDMIDKLTGEVICRHKEADILSKEWSSSEADNLGRAGWNLIVHKIIKSNLSDSELEEILAVVEEQLQTVSPGKQWSMNRAMCEIGIHYPEFTQRCIRLGEDLGVYREMKVSKGCTSAYAPEWIAAGMRNRKK